MRFNWVILITLLLLIIENSVMPWLIPAQWSDRLLPHLTFIMTLFVASFAGRHYAFFFGLGFGLLQDILAYGHLIGPYGFAMALVGYLAGLVAERTGAAIGIFVGIVICCGVILDSLVFFTYKLFQLTSLSYSKVIYWQIAPTVLLQLLFALLLYVPLRRYFVKPSLNAEDNQE